MASEGLVKLGALWVKEKNGTKVLQGKMGDANVLILKNDYKKKAEQPDFHICVSTPKPKPVDDRPAQRQAPDQDSPF